MTKIKITNKQRDLIYLHEQKSSSNALLLENTKEILLGVATLMGFGLSGMNKVSGNNALLDKKTMTQIKNTLDNETKLKELVKMFSEKGMVDAEKRIAKNAKKIVDFFNEKSIANNLGVKLDNKTIATIEGLDPEIEKAREAMKENELEVQEDKLDTHTIFINDVFDLVIPNDYLFNPKTLDLKSEGIKAMDLLVNELNELKLNVTGLNIDVSDDADIKQDFITDYDINGSITATSNMSTNLAKELKKVDNNFKIRLRNIPNNGSDIVNYRQFLSAKGSQLTSLKEKTKGFRYSKFRVSFSVTTTENPMNKVVEYRKQLLKTLGSIGDLTFKKKTLTCKKEDDKSSKCFTR